MVIVDSSGWIEFFTSVPRSAEYRKHFKDVHKVLTPAILLYGVYKKSKREVSEEAALEAVSAMKQTTVVPLSKSISLLATDLSTKHALPWRTQSSMPAPWKWIAWYDELCTFQGPGRGCVAVGAFFWWLHSRAKGESSIFTICRICMKSIYGQIQTDIGR